MRERRLRMKQTGSEQAPDPVTTDGSGIAREPIDDLPALAERVIVAYYSKDYEPLLSRVTDDCVFIGAGNMTFFSGDELRTALPEDDSPAMILRNSHFQLVGDRDPGATRAVVMGTYHVYTGPRETSIIAAKQRVTVCCVLEDGRWKAYHIHTSNEWNELVDDEVFPVKTSTETYRYVRSILRTGRKAGLLPSRIELESSGSQRYVDPDDVLYVEADGKHCIIHCAKETVAFNALLSDVESQLPGTFLRTHRSYLVNTAHVIGMRRFALDLSDGTRLPIPERRYDEIRREIALRVID